LGLLMRTFAGITCAKKLRGKRANDKDLRGVRGLMHMEDKEGYAAD
jgi:hypothetical protein